MTPAPEEHPAFVAPPDPQARIWRYMDFTKFVSMLESGALFFCRADLLGDPFEGSYSRANEALRSVAYKEHLGKDAESSERMFAQLGAVAQQFRRTTYINCWHVNPHESAAMWKLYSQSNEAVAIQSTYSALRDCLPEDAYTGMVKYIDYQRDWMAEGNAFVPFMHKRLSFAHEAELRALIPDFSAAGQALKGLNTEPAIGKFIAVDLSKLVRGIHVSPQSPTWFRDLVVKVVQRYGLAIDVRQSSLADEPFF